MANQFISPDLLTGTALELLRRELMLPRYVTRLGIADFRGRQNDTVSMRVPAILTARDYEFRTRTAPIVLDEIEELSIPVQLDTHVYSAVGLTDEELTLDIYNFTAQVLQPQIIAVAERIEGKIATGMVNATYAHAAVPYTEDANSVGTAFYQTLVEARKVLNAAHVPLANRVVIIGSDVEAAALKEEDLRRANTSGGTQTLRNGELGQLAGFTIVTSQSVPADFGIAMHQSAFAFANVAPVVPDGVTFGRSVSEGGIAMRLIRDYDPNYLRDRSVVSAFEGVSSVDDARNPTTGALLNSNQRAVLLDFTGA